MRPFAVIAPFLLFFSLALPIAYADDEAPPPQEEQASTIANFTRSITKVYVTSEMCNQIDSLHFEVFASVIRDYLGLYYRRSIPYWVLPDVHEHMKSRDQCILALDERVTNYQVASRHFVEEYEDLPPPPVLSMAMLTYETPLTSAPMIPVPAPAASKPLPTFRSPY